jgi:hypothetical protein
MRFRARAQLKKASSCARVGPARGVDFSLDEARWNDLLSPSVATSTMLYLFMVGAESAPIERVKNLRSMISVAGFSSIVDNVLGKLRVYSTTRIYLQSCPASEDDLVGRLASSDIRLATQDCPHIPKSSPQTSPA